MSITHKLDVMGSTPDADLKSPELLIYVPEGRQLAGWVKVASAVAEVTPTPPADILASQVASLHDLRRKLIEDTQAKIRRIDARLQELQALPNGVAA